MYFFFFITHKELVVRAVSLLFTHLFTTQSHTETALGIEKYECIQYLSNLDDYYVGVVVSLRTYVTQYKVFG